MLLAKTLWASGSFTYHSAYNALTRFLPGVSAGLQRLTRDTGRAGPTTGQAAADYFEAVVADYQAIGELTGVVDSGQSLFDGRRVLELGPGDTRSVALILKLHGAAGCEGYDAFDIQSRDHRYLERCYAPILRRAGERDDHARALELLEECPVHVSREQLRAGGRRFDLVLSRAVLEHAGDLDRLFADLADVTTQDAVLMHKVDLRCHDHKHDHELDFLIFPPSVYHVMSSRIDLPNRVRVDEYLVLGSRHGYGLVYAGATHSIPPEEVEAIRPRLARPFRSLPTDVLRVLGVWLVQVGPRHPLARTVVPIRPEHVRPVPATTLSGY